MDPPVCGWMSWVVYWFCLYLVAVSGRRSHLHLAQFLFSAAVNVSRVSPMDVLGGQLVDGSVLCDVLGTILNVGVL